MFFFQLQSSPSRQVRPSPFGRLPQPGNSGEPMKQEKLKSQQFMFRLLRLSLLKDKGVALVHCFSPIQFPSGLHITLNFVVDCGCQTGHHGTLFLDSQMSEQDESRQGAGQEPKDWLWTQHSADVLIHTLSSTGLKWKYQ